MSGFFSLGGSGKEQQQEQEQEDHHQHQHQHHHHHHHHHQDATNSLYLFKNEEIYNKGFELWQQHYQLQQQQQQRLQHHQDVDFSVGPSRRNIISSGSGSTGGGDDSSNYRSGFGLMRQQQGIVVGSGSSNSGGGGGGMNCQDCGNQAKKDCSHLRCRSCCKSRGFQCSTHVKSTWVPAAKRRERQNQLASLQQQQPQPLPQQQQQLSLRGEISKRPRENPSSSSLARLPPSTSGLEVGHFPAELNTPAVFRCVRVSAMDDAEEQYAYQTAVNIGGHVFKGILYDQGVENRYAGGGGGESSSGGGGGGAHQQQPPLNLIASTSAAVTTTTRSTNVVPMFDQCPTPLTAFLAGTQFFPPPRS